MEGLAQIKAEITQAATELVDKAKLKEGQIMVIGCSTSEVQGKKIGTASGPDIGVAIYEALAAVAKEKGFALAFQCCEHLNRAIVTERSVAERNDLYICNAVPQLHAGGAMATTAFGRMTDPVVVEYIKADAGLDIGDTFIGMHLKHVAVPVRLAVKTIGEAHLTAARVRPKYIGGPRAVYDEALM